ncbi:hypothetical protein QZQ97_06780 [Serratia sp. root2]|uniref:hypothetical protein n=1 Tax=Serratia sp. root2 TaxID=3059676 RepID=UPI0028921B14|nr:hypothetical protein [Serratia sp. root2]MDT3250640.1 hypothetical protein [Serratia sp. root2]
MFNFMKRQREKEILPVANYDDEANEIAAEINVLERRLAATPADGDIHKTLMLAYNRAVKLYAKSQNHRHHIDAVFIKMDELRNIIRKNL